MQLFALDFTNPWVESVSKSRRPINAFLVLIAALATVTGSIYLARFGPQIHGRQECWGIAVARALYYSYVFIPMNIMAFGMILAERRAPRRGLNPAAGTLVGSVTGAAAFGLALAILAAAGVMHGRHSAFIGPAPILLSVAIVVFQCFSEEVVFRGWLLPVLATRWGVWIGLFASSIAFGAVHSVSHPFGPLAVAGNILAGLLFGSLALKSGGLAAPVAAHAIWNLSEKVVFGLTPNPGADVLGSLFNLDMIGPAIWTGGSDELNGSLAAVLALAIVTAALLGSDVKRSANFPPDKSPARLRRQTPRIGSRRPGSE